MTIIDPSAVYTDAADRLRLDRDGAELLRGAALTSLDAIADEVARLPADIAGIRIQDSPALSAIVGADGIGPLASRIIGTSSRAVRAVLFDKSASTNWSLGWHQDRTIVVRGRIETDEFGPWTVKGGLVHVEPPIALLEGMVTLRIHLDPVPADNAPLLIAPGSHRLGRIPVDAIGATVARCGIAACLAGPGDVWIYRTTILHASDRARRPMRRRVLQVDYSAATLPNGLEWLGI